MKKSVLNKLGIVFFGGCLIIIVLSNFYSIANVIDDEEITITVDENGNATMVTKNTNDYLINPYKGFCVDDNPVLKEGNILTSKINYEDYWNKRNGSLATEGYARFNWYQFYDNTFVKPNNTRDYKDDAYNWDVLKDFIIVCTKNGVDCRLGVMTANTTGTDSAYGKTDAYSLSKLQEHVMPAGSIMPDGTIVKEGETIYKARNATPMWTFEGIPVGYDDTNKEYIYDTDNDVEYYLDNKELQWIPKWDDKNLIKNINDFVYSLSEYLKNEEYEGKKLIDYISFVEVRSYGNYGENHLTGINNNAKFICGDLDLLPNRTYTYVEPTNCYVTNDKGETYNVFESTLVNNKIRYSLNISAEYYYDNYLTTYLNAFRDTKVTIVMNWAAIWDSTYNDTDGYMPNGRLRKWIEDNKGYLTVRSDSIFLNSFGNATQLYVSNGVAPSAFEYVFSTYKKKFENDNEAIKNNITKDLIQVIQNGRVTYMDFSDDLYTYYVENFDDYESEIAKFGNTLGYYFRLKQAKYNTNIVVNKENNLNIDLSFVNEGVTRLYDKGDSKVYIALLETDSNGNVLYDEFNKTKVVAKYLTDINPTEWNSNLVSINETLDLSNSNNWIKESLNVTVEDVTAGNYMLAVGLFTDYDSDKPSIKLGNTGATLDNWYKLGMVEIVLPIGDVDADGKVNINDWNRMYNHINETSELTSEEFERGDVNKDGKVNIKDWNRIYDYITKVDLLPTQIDALGNVKFTITPNVTEAHPGDEITYTVKMSAVQNLAGIKFKLVIPEGLTFIEGKEVDGLDETLHAVKAEFTESTKIFVAGSSNYSSNTDTTLMTFKCLVNEDVTGDKEIKFIIDEDDIFDTTDDMNNIPIDYSNPGSKVKITIPSTGISLNKTAFSLERGTCETLIATIVPQKTTDTVTWKSSDETKAIVDANGNVTAVAEGTAVITAKTTSGKEATCTITVNKATPEYIIPSDIKATEGQKLSQIELPECFEWMDETQEVIGSGVVTYKAKYIPKDTTKYDIVEDIDINVFVKKVTGYSIPTSKKEYKAFETVDTTGMEIKLYYSDNSEETVTEGINIKYTGKNTSFRYGDTSYIVSWHNDTGCYMEEEIEVTVQKATPEYTIPTNIKALPGQTLSEIELPTGFEWMDDTQIIEFSENSIYKAKYIPDDTTNYEIVENIEITIEVDKKQVEIYLKYESLKYLLLENIEKG